MRAVLDSNVLISAAITEDNQTALDALGQAISRDWIDQPATARSTSSTHTQRDNQNPTSPTSNQKSPNEREKSKRLWNEDEPAAEQQNDHDHSDEGYSQHRPNPDIEHIQPADPHHAA